MKNIRIFLYFLVTVMVATPGYALNKCTDEQGKISFQDALCNPGQKSEINPNKHNRDSNSVENLDPLYVEVPGVGTAVLFSYKWWNSSIIQPDPELPPTVKMIARNGEEPISFSITFIPNKNGKKVSLEESIDTVYEIASRFVEGSVERKVNLRKLDTTIGPAVLASFNEAKYLNNPVPPGEYSSITVGQAAHSKLVVGFTILTDGTHSRALTEAFNILGSFQIVANK